MSKLRGRNCRHRAELSPRASSSQAEASSALASGDLYVPPRILYDPPVVDIFEGVTGHLLLVGAASATLVSVGSHQERNASVCGLAKGLGSPSLEAPANTPSGGVQGK